MPKSKSCELCCIEFVGLPPTVATCENSLVKICLDECSPKLNSCKSKISWQESVDGRIWIDLPLQHKKCLEFIATSADNGKYYRARILNGGKCWISQWTQLEVLPSSSLILDTGVVGNSIGFPAGAFPQDFLWLNRFTPSSYPFILKEIQIYFASNINGNSTHVSVGDPVDFYVWENLTGNVDPAVGSVFRGSLIGRQVLELDAFNSYILPKPIVFDGPGDVLIGAVNRLQVAPYFPAALNTENSQQRSWVGFDYPNGIATYPPFLPAPTWFVIDDLAPQFAGNWMIRGIGCGGSQEPIQLAIQPSAALSASAASAASAQSGLTGAK